MGDSALAVNRGWQGPDCLAVGWGSSPGVWHMVETA